MLTIHKLIQDGSSYGNLTNWYYSSLSNIISSMKIESVAQWFLSKEPMTQKKLQKLCYYAVAWGWALMNKPIVLNGEFEAWRHGPVSKTLYTKYKINGWNLIQPESAIIDIPKDTKELLEAVWLTYGDKSGNELEALSHSEKPWLKARAGLLAEAPSTRKISSNDMISFYNSIKSSDF